MAHGYDVTFVSQTDEDFQCAICMFVLRDPVQAVPCGHRFCQWCINACKER